MSVIGRAALGPLGRRDHARTRRRCPTWPWPTPVRPSRTASTAPMMVDRRRVVVFLESAPAPRRDRRRPGTPAWNSATSSSSRACWRSPPAHRRFSQQRHDVPQRVLAVAHEDVRPRPLPAWTQSESMRFDRPGIVPVFCDIHSHMSAYILVFGHPFFAVSDTSGRYAIRGVPAGTYAARRVERARSAPSRSSDHCRDGGGRGGFRPRRRRHEPCSRHSPTGSSWRARCSSCSRSAVAIYRRNVAVSSAGRSRLRTRPRRGRPRSSTSSTGPSSPTSS